MVSNETLCSIDKSLIYFAWILSVKERDKHLNDFISSEILLKFTLLNHHSLDKDTVIEIFESFSKSKGVGIARMGQILATS